MKKALKRRENNLYYYKNGVRVEGVHSLIRGNVTGLAGNINDCQLAKAERKKGVNIKDLVEGGK